MMLFGGILALLMINFFISVFNGERNISERVIPIGILLVLLIAVTAIGMTKEEKPEVKRREIYSLGLNKGAVNAQSFFLGSNGVEYLYYTGDSISGFNLESIPARKTTIKYTNDKPFVVINEITTTTFISSSTEIDRIELYIPKGSIIEDYKIDL